MPSYLYVLILMIVCSLNFSGCEKSNDEQPYPIVISKQLEKLNKPQKPLPAIKLIKHYEVITVSSCKTFTEKLGEYKLVETPNNMQLYWDYIPCVANRLLAKAKSSQKSAFINFESLIMENLDLKGFNSSLRPRLSNTDNTLKALGMKNNSKDNTEILIETTDWKYQWTLLAQGDFNGDGVEDVMLRFLDQAKKSNYFSVQLLVLQSNDADDRWSAHPG